MFAWARRNNPNVTLRWFQKFLGDVFEPEWERLSQWREKELNERNAKRRKLYQERKCGIKKPRHPNLGERIYLELNLEPSTAKVLASTSSKKDNRKPVATHECEGIHFQSR